MASWMSSFDRSPECATLALDYQLYSPDFNPNVPPPPSFSQCPNNLPGSGLDYLPGGIFNMWGGQTYFCCGYCTLNVPKVRVIYFPDESAPSCNHLGSGNSTVTPAASWNTDSPVTATLSGYTFTSPSIYVQVIGTANVTDYCGQVGGQYTDVIVPIPSGGLSSYSWDVPVGGSFSLQENFFSAPFTKAVQVTDLQCPTWGIATTTPDMYQYLFVGPPFNPMIQPPPQLTEIDPKWAACPGYFQQGDLLASWAIMDPPYALTPAGQVGPISVPPKTTSDPPRMQTAAPAQPLTTVPSWTGSVVLQSGNTASASNPAIGGNTASASDPKQGIGGIIYSAFGGVPITLALPSPVLGPSSSLLVPASPASVSAAPDPQTGATAIIVDGVTLTASGAGMVISGMSISLEPGGELLVGSSTANINTLDFVTPASAAPPKSPSPLVYTIAGQILTADPPSIPTEDTTTTPNGAHSPLSGTPISQSPEVIILGTSTITIDPPSRTAPAVLTIGNSLYSYTLNAASPALVIGTQTLVPGASITVPGGDVLSLDPSGTAVVIAAPGASVVTESLVGGPVASSPLSAGAGALNATGTRGVAVSNGAPGRGAWL
ncbi:hypothetical protein MMC18_008282, partial [Xylographa bjoerkii]|nr:hypothetical protein [Xylographa bjoerkii]